MIIKTLAENEAVSAGFKTEHGLSLYIETNQHKILFDLGQSGLFLENARKMQVDITEVDLVVISHGHYDHGGGIKEFLNENTHAKIYLHKKAFENHFARRSDSLAYIGLNQELKDHSRIVLVDDYLRIDKELELFSAVRGRELYSTANQVLLMQAGEEVIEDRFEHEQNLIITEDSKLVLVAGCAHNGIVNIVKRMLEIKNRNADYVMGGFHLYNPQTKQSEDEDLIKSIGWFLVQTGSQYYTCHCTGSEAFEHLKAIMHDKIEYSATGRVIEI